MNMYTEVFMSIQNVSDGWPTWPSVIAGPRWEIVGATTAWKHRCKVQFIKFIMSK